LDAAALDVYPEEFLKTVEQSAKDKGQAVLLATPYPVTIEALRIWLASLSGKGIEVIPVTALAKINMADRDD
jgi:polysaccharide deacetylase 2 family uncharacterized protein YibQ